MMHQEKETPEVISEDVPESTEESLKKEIADLKDRLLRSFADLENERKRFTREKEDISKFAITGFARDLLAVSDNLLRASESIPQELLPQNETLKALHEGVIMTAAELAKVFEKHKVEVINPEGQKFDHNEHQAMFHVSETDAPEGTVVQVLQKGYKLYDRLLRPAMVSVAQSKKS